MTKHKLTSEPKTNYKYGELFFWVFSVLTLFLFLGHNALWASEDRWAEIAREMIISGDYLHPSINWQVYFDKPHLTYWLILPFAILRGMFDEFIVRIPSALAGLAGLWGIRILGKKLFSPGTALLSGWLLLGCYGFLFWARTAAADMANMAAIVVAVAYFYQIEERAKFYHYFAFYLICFIGAWAKGLPALVMPFVVIAPHLLADKRWIKHLKITNFSAFLIAGGIYFLPFYFASILPLESPQHLPPGEALTGLELVWRENIVRVFNAFDHKDPFYSYFYNLPRVLLPWILVVAVAIAGMLRNWKRLPNSIRELMIGTLLMFVLFCCSTSRRWYYILPVMPFCVLLAATGLTGWSVEKWNRPVLSFMRILVIFIASLGVASLIGLPLWYRFFNFDPPLLSVIALPLAGALVLAVVLLDNQSDSPIERLTGLPQRLGSLVLGVAILMAAGFDCVYPSLTKYRTEKQFYIAFAEMDSEISPEQIFIWRSETPPKLLFYLNLPRPVKDSSRDVWKDGLSPEAMQNMPSSQRKKLQFQRNFADLEAFIEKNRGRAAAIFSYDRKTDLELLKRAAEKLALPIDLSESTLNEQKFNVRNDKSKKLVVWVFNIPQKSEEIIENDNKK
ncbi:MAG: glycosyltransferase family 39 protein [Victivallales bacterium]|jgi:4-amino-4-deoxy-L-arabinose transferase-like glycosyltransferase|nr:glycosyltransferase family 39 protein [Victivallales bacterium]